MENASASNVAVLGTNVKICSMDQISAHISDAGGGAEARYFIFGASTVTEQLTEPPRAITSGKR